MRRTFRYKAKLNTTARHNAEWQLDRLRELYNAALEERIGAWKRAGVSISFADQCRSLTEIRNEIRPEYGDINRAVAEDALRRLDRAFLAFFRRCKAGEKPGYPRFKGRHRYNSLTFRPKGGGYRVDGRDLSMDGIGRAKLFLSRPILGDIKTVTLKRDRCGDWWVTFSCDNVPAEPLPTTCEAVGVDVGLASYLTTSDGEMVPNPRVLREAEVRLKQAQRRVSRRKRGGGRRRAAVRQLAVQYRKVDRARRDFLWKAARSLVERYDYIAVEDLNIKGMVRSRTFAKSVSDAAWGEFIACLNAKAESAGRVVVAVNPLGTSQACSGCGCEVRKTLSERTHRCPECGLVLDRDINAARNILALARAEAPPAGSRPASKAAAMIREPASIVGCSTRRRRAAVKAPSEDPNKDGER